MDADAWAELLTNAAPREAVASLATGLGFDALSPLNAATRSVLGLPDDLDEVLVAPGPGTTRLLTVHATGLPARDRVTQLAATLSRRAPHLLWLLVLAAPDRDELVIAAWHSGPANPRVSALLVNRRDVHGSDVETVVALAQAPSQADVLVHARWVEILGREAITRRFYVTLREVVADLATNANGRATTDVRREVAMLQVSRLLFLSFLEARGWLDGDHHYLARVFAEHATGERGDAARFQRRVLEPLFFGTLNTPAARRAPGARALGRIPFLNGGLFARANVESRHRHLAFPDATWGRALDRLFLRFRFTAREEGPDWRESAIDPDILGRAFESLMAGDERHTRGVFYTPFALVERLTDGALRSALSARGVDAALVDRSTELPVGPAQQSLLRAVRDLRVIDPACGSGAFLVHVLERLTRLHVVAGDRREPFAIRRDVLTRSIFGVDINATAVWLCELRLWLALVVDHDAPDAMAIPPLPNLDHNIRCGDTLAGGDLASSRVASSPQAGTLHARYARATGARKRTLARALDRAERAALIAWLDTRLDAVAARRRGLVGAARGRDLFGGRRGVLAAERDAARQLRLDARELRARRRSAARGGALPFAFPAHFPDAATAGGFDVVIGNPPWIRLHHIPEADRHRWRTEFRVFRDAAWLPGARAARAGSGFGAQVDASALFLERGLHLLRARGTLAFLVPAKLWRSLAGGGVRRLLMQETGVRVLEDWSHAPALFDAATYPSIVIATADRDDTECIQLGVHRGRMNVSWLGSRRDLPLDESPGAPWLLLPPEPRAGFDRLSRHGVMLADAGLGTLSLGVKCGLNEAFLVSATGCPEGVEVTDGTRRAVLDHDLVRPVLRGEGVRAWSAARNAGHILFPCTVDGRVLASLPAGARAWLLPWRNRLAARADARGHRAWWSVFRLEGSRPDRPRVVWADVARSLQALMLEPGDRTVPLNTCYVLPTRDEIDAFALCAYLNSPVANAWVGALAEPARGGYRRHLAWTMARLPVPDDWDRARQVLGPLGERGCHGEPPGSADLSSAVLDAFRLRARQVAPLVEWMHG